MQNRDLYSAVRENWYSSAFIVDNKIYINEHVTTDSVRSRVSTAWVGRQFEASVIDLFQNRYK